MAIKYAASWSGGKDSCLAAWKARQEGLDVSYLLNMINEDSTRSMSHGLSPKLLAMQAKAAGLPVWQEPVNWQTYEAGFKKALAGLRQKGIGGLIAGDIYLQAHKDWVDRVCAESGIFSRLPLWEQDTTRLLNEIIELGFKAVIVCVEAKHFGSDWVGREINRGTADDLIGLSRTKGIDPCGEGGEYHTFVYDGPLFKQPVKILNTSKALRDKHWFLDITDYCLV